MQLVNTFYPSDANCMAWQLNFNDQQAKTISGKQKKQNHGVDDRFSQ